VVVSEKYSNRNIVNLFFFVCDISFELHFPLTKRTDLI